METLSPETTRLLARLTVALTVFAGLGLLAAFVLGIVREGAVRWLVLALALLCFALPLVVRRLLP